MDSEKVKSLKEALQFSPNNVPLILHLADTYLEEKNYEQAINSLKQALSFQNDNKIKLKLANTYFLAGNYATAIVLFEDIETASFDAKSFVFYAKSHLRENNLKEAKEIYEQAVDVFYDLTDEELDNHFRLSNIEEEEEEEFEDDFDYRLMEKPNINFDNVGGMDRVKKEIDMKIIQPMKNQELFKAYGKKIGGGILLYGPPGCGKTHIARATAGQMDAKFINVGINDILDMWIGNSEKNLHQIFDYARKNTPCVLFFDEVDALGASRADLKQSSGRHVINQFLSELDGIESDNEGILILGATNTPWNLDTAFRRPGRFDRIIFVEPPDLKGRETILELILKEKPISDLDYNAIAKKTEEFSGADLNALVDIAVESVLEEAMKTGEIKPLVTKDLVKAAKKHRPSTKEWFSTAKNYAMYANDSGLYDDILTYLKMK